MASVDLPQGLGLLALLACVALGCGADSGEDVPTGPRVILGTGREQFQMLEPEAAVPLIKGIQGGFHVWTSFIAYGFDTDVLRMELATRWDTLEDSVLEMKGNVSVNPMPDERGEVGLASLGWPATIFNPACANGRRLRLDLTVLDTEGHTASDRRYCIVDVAEEDRSSDCSD